MAEPVIPPRAKLFIGVLTTTDLLLDAVERRLVKKYGEIDYQTIKIGFSHTQYYKSMGSNLFKVFFSFKKLIKREQIIAVKLHCNKLEQKISGKETRRVNIDPGYLTLSNVYLASCKEFFHRIYLGKGIYLENEYRYVAKKYEPWDWTYPDYKKQEYLHFFHSLRRIYQEQIKK